MPTGLLYRSVYLCRSISLCRCTCLPTCRHTCRYACACTYRHTCRYTCAYTRRHACRYTCAYTCRRTCRYTRAYTCRHTCRYTCADTCRHSCLHTMPTSAQRIFFNNIFLTISRSVPTANAEDPRRSQGTERRVSPRPFRCRPPTRSGPRHSPSACAEKLLKKKTRRHARMHVCSSLRSGLNMCVHVRFYL